MSSSVRSLARILQQPGAVLVDGCRRGCAHVLVALDDHVDAGAGDVLRRGECGERSVQSVVRALDLERDAEAAAFRLGGKRRDGALQHDLPMGHDAHAMADALHLLQLVRREEDGDALPGAQVLDDAEQPDDAGGVEAERGVVQDDELRLLEQDVGQAEALAHAARVLHDGLVGGVLELDHVEQLGDARVGVGARDAVELGGEAEVLCAGQVAVEADGLREVADPPLDGERVTRGVVAADADGPGARLGEAQHHEDAGALARAVGAEESEDLALVDGEVDGVHGGEPAVALGEPAGLDQRAHRLPSLQKRPPRMRMTTTTRTMPSQPQMVDWATVTRSSIEAFVSGWLERRVTR